MKNLVVAHAVAVAIKENEDFGNESGLQKVVSDPITGLVYAASNSKLYAIDVKEKKVGFVMKKLFKCDLCLEAMPTLSF